MNKPITIQTTSVWGKVIVCFPNYCGLEFFNRYSECHYYIYIYTLTSIHTLWGLSTVIIFCVCIFVKSTAISKLVRKTYFEMCLFSLPTSLFVTSILDLILVRELPSPMTYVPSPSHAHLSIRRPCLFCRFKQCYV